MESNIILACVQILAVSITPFILWFVQKKYQDRKARQEAKLNLFLTVMANRKPQGVPKELADAYNTIDIVFQDNKSVRNAWSNYFESLHTQSIKNSSQDIYLLILLSEMANSLGYKDLSQADLDNFYMPQHFANRFELESQVGSEYLRVLKNSYSFAKSIENKKDDSIEKES